MIYGSICFDQCYIMPFMSAFHEIFNSHFVIKPKLQEHYKFRDNITEIKILETKHNKWQTSGTISAIYPYAVINNNRLWLETFE